MTDILQDIAIVLLAIAGIYQNIAIRVHGKVLTYLIDKEVHKECTDDNCLFEDFLDTNLHK